MQTAVANPPSSLDSSPRQDNPSTTPSASAPGRGSYADPKLEARRLAAIAALGTRYLGHPTHGVRRGVATTLAPRQHAELYGWICAAEHLEQIARELGAAAGRNYLESARCLRTRARELYGHGAG